MENSLKEKKQIAENLLVLMKKKGFTVTSLRTYAMRNNIKLFQQQTDAVFNKFTNYTIKTLLVICEIIGVELKEVFSQSDK